LLAAILEFFRLPRSSDNYRPEIDGLRAFAVIAVIANHFSKDLLPSGYLGVDIFFVISGYVITASLSNREHKSLGDFLLGFYTRRIKRLLPTLVICIVITCVSGFLFIPSESEIFNVEWRTGIAALFGLSNLYLFSLSTDYFAISTELNLFTQTWSLGVEEQFYLIFPFILWFSGFSRNFINGKRYLFFIMILISTASLCAYIWVSRVDQSAAYFLMPFRFWELGSGCIAYLFVSSRKPLYRIFKFANPSLTFTLIIIVLLMPGVAIYRSTTAIVVLTTLLIATIKSHSKIYRVLSWQPLVFIGLISYSLYLWHWSIFTISRWTIGLSKDTIALQLSLIFVLSLLSWKYIEGPFRYISWSKSRGYSILIGVLTSFACAGFMFGLGNPLKGFLYVGEKTDFIEKTWWHDKNGKYIEKCHAEREYSDKLFNECVTSIDTEDRRQKVYIFGDSHARNYLVAIEKALPEYNVRYMTMGNGCAFMPVDEINTALNSATSCKNYVLQVQNYAKSHIHKGDIIFIGQIEGHQLDRGYSTNVIELAKSTQKSGGKFILLADVPGMKKEPLFCMRQPWRVQVPEECIQFISDVDNNQRALDKIGNDLESEVKNSFYLNVRSELCNDKLCSLYKGAVPLYHDLGHLTNQSSELLAKPIRKRLAKFLSLN
jgi:peptidoglycan/LPS O-acetylase OafA/YrhL